MFWVTLRNGLVVCWTGNSVRHFWHRKDVPNGVLAYASYRGKEQKEPAPYVTD